MNEYYVALIPGLPLASFVLLGIFGRKYLKEYSGAIGTLALLVSCVLSLIVAKSYFFDSEKINGAYQSIVLMNHTWLSFTPTISIKIGAMIDPISVMMLVVVTFVSLMVHIFSLEYMKGEERFATYYAFLGLFTFSMLGLVLSSNIFQIYMFWELVGVSSFLLIGYYYEKPSAVAASKKAFIVTRFADLGFLIGILILSFHAETLDFKLLIAKLTDLNSPEYLSITTGSFLGISALTWGLCLIFMGGAGKSAMFPLHIWLPDAMEGPTPVSALIHAATMVVAGVFLVARLFPLFSNAEAALHLVGYVGIVSSMFAAIIACTQTDIKRVLAFSTMSQIGYMMFSLSVAKYGGENGLGFLASMFHLFTHAFFKSLMFLGAGVIIHFVHNNDMSAMGGLRKYLPVTNITFLIGCLAISGIPPFAGFFSKEEILTACSNENKTMYWLALITSGVTAFYMFRLYFSIFWNKEAHVHGDHHHEAGWAMKLPLILLAICSIGAGLVPFGQFVTSDGLVLPTHVDLAFSALPVTLAVIGIAIAWMLYKNENSKSSSIATGLGGLYTAIYKKFYIDELYIFITKKIIFNLIGRPAAWIDTNIINGTVNLTASLTASVSETIKGLQSGRLQQYLLYFFGGLATLALIFIYLIK